MAFTPSILVAMTYPWKIPLTLMVFFLFRHDATVLNFSSPSSAARLFFSSF